MRAGPQPAFHVLRSQEAADLQKLVCYPGELVLPARMRAGAVPFQLEAKLKELGAKVQPADINMENAVQDGTLVTGQNHNSGKGRRTQRRFAASYSVPAFVLVAAAGPALDVCACGTGASRLLVTVTIPLCSAAARVATLCLEALSTSPAGPTDIPQFASGTIVGASVIGEV